MLQARKDQRGAPVSGFPLSIEACQIDPLNMATAEEITAEQTMKHVAKKAAILSLLGLRSSESVSFCNPWAMTNSFANPKFLKRLELQSPEKK